MSIRWRKDGTLVCAAMFPEEEDDTYIDDSFHYAMSVIHKVIYADENHNENGLWHWSYENKIGVSDG